MVEEICEHCRKRNATWQTKPPACMYCINTGHKGGKSIADCPLCSPPKPEGDDDGERLVTLKQSPLKKAA